ncbi:hypothetical protein [Leptolyngbya sp. CCY15150]|uniref:hypothetical protein n=1 Tax=Leptolyngbya sp. CCY15150 TaxID=2767772 RepID=UPI00194E6821|nr:hypothetical protein [Leptolyngbya sp. CCY15150]
MNTFLKCMGVLLVVAGLQGVALVSVQARSLADTMPAEAAALTELHQSDGYIPPDNGAPDRTQGSGTR